METINPFALDVIVKTIAQKGMCAQCFERKQNKFKEFTDELVLKTEICCLYHTASGGGYRALMEGDATVIEQKSNENLLCLYTPLISENDIVFLGDSKYVVTSVEDVNLSGKLLNVSLEVVLDGH